MNLRNALFISLLAAACCSSCGGGTTCIPAEGDCNCRAPGPLPDLAVAVPTDARVGNPVVLSTDPVVDQGKIVLVSLCVWKDTGEPDSLMEQRCPNTSDPLISTSAQFVRPPYAQVWTPVEPGSYRLLVKAFTDACNMAREIDAFTVSSK